MLTPCRWAENRAAKGAWTVPVHSQFRFWYYSPSGESWTLTITFCRGAPSAVSVISSRDPGRCLSVHSLSSIL